MKRGKLNERIEEEIRRGCEGKEKIIEEFLIELIDKEAEHPTTWWWKREYVEILRKYLKEGEKNAAN